MLFVPPLFFGKLLVYESQVFTVRNVRLIALFFAEAVNSGLDNQAWVLDRLLGWKHNIRNVFASVLHLSFVWFCRVRPIL